VLKFLIQRKIINNQYINPIWRFFGFDAWLNNRSQYYLDFKPNENLSLQEIAGYSNKPEINATLSVIHNKLQSVIIPEIEKSNHEFNLLDIGCGPGLFLKDFEGKAQLTGIDISKAMVNIALSALPQASIIQAHFLKHVFSKRFDAIYSIGVLIYFNHSQIRHFFQKIFDLLNDSGLV
jgi:SAM-dependent methyltransferase